MILSASTNWRLSLRAKERACCLRVSSMVVRMFCSVAGWAQSSAALGSSLLHAASRIVLKINTEAVFLYMGTPEGDGLSDGLTCLS